ncbi:hypothetical protein D3C74_403760 [compost metagenome]
MLQLRRCRPGCEDLQHRVVFQPRAKNAFQWRVDLGEQPADPVAGLGDLPGQIQVESGEHAQGGFILVRDLDTAQRVRHGARRISDDERVFSSVFAVPGYMAAMRRIESPGM